MERADSNNKDTTTKQDEILESTYFLRTNELLITRLYSASVDTDIGKDAAEEVWLSRILAMSDCEIQKQVKQDNHEPDSESVGSELAWGYTSINESEDEELNVPDITRYTSDQFQYGTDVDEECEEDEIENSSVFKRLSKMRLF